MFPQPIADVGFRLHRLLYTQNMNALGLVVSEKKIFLCFSHCKSMGANDPRGRAIFYPRDMIDRIYIEGH